MLAIRKLLTSSVIPRQSLMQVLFQLVQAQLSREARLGSIKAQDVVGACERYCSCSKSFVYKKTPI